MSATSFPSSPGAPTLVLLPTELERERLFAVRPLAPGLGLVECVGFGPLAAAARTAELLARLAPRRVLLLGIAGTYDPRILPVGAAARFECVVLDGAGAGQGEARSGPRELGFPQWRAEDATGEDVWDEIVLGGGGTPASVLLTVCSASASAAEARERAERFHAPLAEDMEGFGVALACAMQGVPLAIVRGASNLAGERDPSSWQIDAALAAASELAALCLATSDPWPAPRGGAGE